MGPDADAFVEALREAAEREGYEAATPELLAQLTQLVNALPPPGDSGAWAELEHRLLDLVEASEAEVDRFLDHAAVGSCTHVAIFADSAAGLIVPREALPESDELLLTSSTPVYLVGLTKVGSAWEGMPEALAQFDGDQTLKSLVGEGPDPHADTAEPGPFENLLREAARADARQRGPTEGDLIAGRYRVEIAAGRGGFGAVYRTLDLKADPPVHRAVKVLNSDKALDSNVRARFSEEASIGQRIDNPSVVRVFEAGDDERFGPYFVMEWLEGRTLAEELVDSGALSLREARHLLEGVCKGLSAIHYVGIIHRDLKPENVFLHVERKSVVVAKVLDLGAAKRLGMARPSRDVTQAIGTDEYMAPELLRAQGEVRVDKSTDVWALGLLAFRVLTGKSYWRARQEADAGPLALYDEILETECGQASARASELGATHLLPEGFDEWFSRCVRVDRSKRYRDADWAWRDLEPLLAERVEAQQVAVTVESERAPVEAPRATEMEAAASGESPGRGQEELHPGGVDETARERVKGRAEWPWPAVVAFALMASIPIGGWLLRDDRPVHIDETPPSVAATEAPAGQREGQAGGLSVAWEVARGTVERTSDGADRSESQQDPASPAAVSPPGPDAGGPRRPRLTPAQERTRDRFRAECDNGRARACFALAETFDSASQEHADAMKAACALGLVKACEVVASNDTASMARLEALCSEDKGGSCKALRTVDATRAEALFADLCQKGQPQGCFWREGRTLREATRLCKLGYDPACREVVRH